MWEVQAQSRAPACIDQKRLPRDMKPVVEGACLAGSRNLKGFAATDGHCPSHPAGF
jgi:hypothetical protein